MRLLQIVAVWWLLLATGGWSDVVQDTRQPNNIVVNPVFKDAPNPREGGQHHAVGWSKALPPGSTALKGWIVAGSGATVSAGEQGDGRSVQLFPTNAMEQDLRTTAGHPYHLTFGWVMNPELGPEATLEVRVGSQTQTFSLTNRDGREESVLFTPDSSETRVEFLLHKGLCFLYAVAVLPYDSRGADSQAALIRLYPAMQQAYRIKDAVQYFKPFSPQYQYVAAEGEPRSLEAYKLEVEKQWGDATRVNAVESLLLNKVTVDGQEAHVAVSDRVTWSATPDQGTRHEYSVRILRQDEWQEQAGAWVLMKTTAAAPDLTVDGMKPVAP